MTQLDQNYASGNMFTVGAVRASSVGPSGINDIVGRINFANYTYPQLGSLAFTYTAGRITKVVSSGADQIYETNVVYDGGFVGSAVTSGTSIGSIITVVLYNNGASFVSGVTKIE